MTAQRTGYWLRRWSAAIAAAMIALVLTACAAALWYVDSQGEKVIALQQRQALESELDHLAQQQRDEGDASLARAVNRRAELEGAARVVALRDASGAIVAGNLRAWPEGVGDSEAWARAPAHAGSFRGQVATRRLAHGLTALVGADDRAFREFRRAIADAVWIAIAVVAATCLALAAVTINFLLQRAAGLSQVAARVSAGDFTARAPAGEASGPFGDIAHAQNAMLDRIESLIVGLRTVTDSLAHDLRTPLAQTRRRLEEGLLAQGAEAKQAALEEALKQTDRTLSTFTALVDIARAEGGVSREAMADADLAQLAEDVRDLFGALADEKGLVLRSHFEAVRMRVHKPLLMQAMSNLTHNAIKYAPPGSQILLALEHRKDGAAFIVADNGPGIPAERRADAVRRFKRLGEADGEHEGLGLGLAIVEACARLHGGRLALSDNAPGLRAELILEG